MKFTSFDMMRNFSEVLDCVNDEDKDIQAIATYVEGCRKAYPFVATKEDLPVIDKAFKCFSDMQEDVDGDFYIYGYFGSDDFKSKHYMDRHYMALFLINAIESIMTNPLAIKEDK